MAEPGASLPIDIEAAARRAMAGVLSALGREDAGTGDATARFSADLRAEGLDLADEVRRQAKAIGTDCERQRAECRADIARLWGPAFDQYLAIARLADEATSHVLERRQNHARSSSTLVDPRLTILSGLQARMSQVMTEVHNLASDGLPGGALARARTGHELAVFATLLSEFGAPDGDHPDLTRRFRDHARVQSYQDANSYQTHGAGDLSDDRMTKLLRARDQAVADHGAAIKDLYGWAAVLFRPGLRLQFPHLEELAGLRHTRSFYKRANHDVHATARSLELNTHAISRDRVQYLTGRSVAGLAEPVSMALHSLLQVMSGLLLGTGEPENVVSLVTCAMLTEIANDADAELFAASGCADAAAGGPTPSAH